MDVRTAWATLAGNFTLGTLLYKSAQVICIAIAFEFIAWWLGRRIEKMVSPFITVDADREHNWRIRRRTTLRHTPKIISRTLCYSIAIILVFDIFGVPVLSLALALAAVIALFGAAMLPVLRDIAQGYTLLAEDVLAVGDAVDIDGHQGVIEKFTLRGVWLRDNAGRLHCLSNRDVKDIVVHGRRTGDNPTGNRA